MSKVAVICVPFIRYDEHALYALQTILSIKQQETSHDLDLIAIVNYVRDDSGDMDWIRQHFDFFAVNDVNVLARAWNIGMNAALSRGAEYFLFLNLDILLQTTCIEKLVSRFEKLTNVLMLSPSSWEDKNTLETAPSLEEIKEGGSFSCFLTSRKLLDTVGPFDEQFAPAYHEDSDMAYRVRLAGFDIKETKETYFWHMENATLKVAIARKDEDFLLAVRLGMNHSMELYKAKWGGLPGGELFKTPYNRIGS